jgi:NAD(P)-dependent dehydrogenase (short-subunit alcohol dehydrogenase family)
MPLNKQSLSLAGEALLDIPATADRVSHWSANQEDLAMSTAAVLITGALTGIGRAAAIAFAQEGYRVAVSGRREDAGQSLAAELRGLGTDAEFIAADVRREEDVRNLIDRAAARFGSLDVAVNNAGTEGKPGPVTDQSAESFAATFETNVLGTLLSMKHELRVMQAQGYGSIINVSSTFGHRGVAGASLYSASKHAVEGLTKSAALEAAEYGIRVNAVAPGPTDTDMLTRFAGSAERKAALQAGVPMKRLGKPSEVANAILFLASGQASYVTGQILSVNGGKTAA